MAVISPASQNAAILPVVHANDAASNAAANDRLYKIRLVVKDPNLMPPGSSGDSLLSFEANLSERYHMSMSSQWNSPFAKSDLADMARDKGLNKTAAIISAGSALTGISTKTRGQSMQVWESSSPMSFSFDMKFMAASNTDAEIRQKHLLLLKLCAPSIVGGNGGAARAAGILSAPGPTPVDALANWADVGGRKITLYIGGYLKLDGVVIKSVSSDMTSLCGADGIPIGMNVQVEVESFFACYTVQDLDDLFMMK